jgi:hypothetical protein
MDFIGSLDQAITDGVTVNIATDNTSLIYFGVALFLAIILAIVGGGLILKTMGVK